MLHFHYVGHFDPRDFVDASEKPYRPKDRHPSSREAMVAYSPVSTPMLLSTSGTMMVAMSHVGGHELRTGDGRLSIGSPLPSPRRRARSS